MSTDFIPRARTSARYQEGVYFPGTYRSSGTDNFICDQLMWECQSIVASYLVTP